MPRAAVIRETTGSERCLELDAEGPGVWDVFVGEGSRVHDVLDVGVDEQPGCGLEALADFEHDFAGGKAVDVVLRLVLVELAAVDDGADIADIGEVGRAGGKRTLGIDFQ